MDLDRPAAGRPRRFRRHDLRPERLLSEAAAAARRRTVAPPEKPMLFGEKEGKIAWANRKKDPLYLFAALQRHLGYPPSRGRRSSTRRNRSCRYCSTGSNGWRRGSSCWRKSRRRGELIWRSFMREKRRSTGRCKQPQFTPANCRYRLLRHTPLTSASDTAHVLRRLQRRPACFRFRRADRAAAG